jgi:hypothetical protein
MKKTKKATEPLIRASELIKKGNENFPHLEGNQKGSVAKSYMTNDLLIYGLILAPFLIY